MNRAIRVRELIERQSSESQLISARLPVSKVNLLDELASEINKTRTELIEVFIESGIEELISQLEQLDCEQDITIPDGNGEKRFFMVNTNYNNLAEDHYMMIDNQEVAAFYSKWKVQIKKIKKGDIVFLYHSGNGICAMGEASGDLIIRDHNGDKDECYAMKLNSFTCNFDLINAKKCKEITKSNLMFRRVMNHLDANDGIALQDYILNELSN